MSCVTRIIARFRRLLEVAQLVQHLALHDHVERGHRLVGDHQRRFQRQRQRDRGALAHAATELMRIVGQADADRGRPAASTARARVQRGSRAADRRARTAPRASGRSAAAPDRARSSRSAARMTCAASAARGVRVRTGGKFAALEHDAAAGDAACAGQHAHQARGRAWICRSRSRRPGPRCCRREHRDRRHRPRARSRRGAVVDLQAANREQGH